MNYKKTLIASIAALAAVGFLAGCGGEKAAAPAKSAAPDKAVTIKVGVSPRSPWRNPEFRKGSAGQGRGQRGNRGIHRLCTAKPGSE